MPSSREDPKIVGGPEDLHIEDRSPLIDAGKDIATAAPGDADIDENDIIKSREDNLKTIPNRDLSHTHLFNDTAVLCLELYYIHATSLNTKSLENNTISTPEKFP